MVKTRTNDFKDTQALRERLEGLMLFRVVLVTIFLGSTIAIDVSTLAEFSNLRNLTLSMLIVSTYVLTIVYGVLIKRHDNVGHVATLQIIGDMMLTTLLAAITGALDSIFIFLFFLIIISSAVVAPRRGPMAVAAVSSIIFILLALISAGHLSILPFAAPAAPRPAKNLGFDVVINSVGAFLIAYLAGSLSSRLGQATVELEKQQSDIRELRALTENILASLSSGLLAINSQRRVIFFNRAAETITGWPADLVLGYALDDRFPTIAQMLDQTDNTRRPAPLNHLRFQGPFQRPDDAEAYLGFSVSVLRNAEHAAVGRIIIFQDLTEIRKLEQRMKQSERLAAIGQLAAAIAHEIRNPLASISGSVEMLKGTSKISSDDQALMDIVLREVARLNSLITDFLEYSRPRPLRLEPTNIEAAVEETLRLFEGRSQERRGAIKIDLHTDLPEEGAQVRVDPEALRQILWNLLNNATDAVSGTKAHSRQISICLKMEVLAGTPCCLVVVEDDGPGISTADAGHIFEPFFTTKQGGTGLGLATIYRLVEEHGGSISLESPVHLRGARFEIRLPQSETSLDDSSSAVYLSEPIDDAAKASPSTPSVASIK